MKHPQDRMRKEKSSRVRWKLRMWGGGWNDTHRVGLQFFHQWRQQGAQKRFSFVSSPLPFLTAKPQKWCDKKKKVEIRKVINWDTFPVLLSFLKNIFFFQFTLYPTSPSSKISYMRGTPTAYLFVPKKGSGARRGSTRKRADHRTGPYLPTS